MKTIDIIYADYCRYVELGEEPAIKHPTKLLSIFPHSWGGNKLLIKAIIARNHCFAFTYWLRILQSNPWKPIKLFAKVMYTLLSRNYGLQIQPETNIGPGLYIGHGIGIVMNPKTKIGKNCNLSQLTTIGSNKGTPASIGDNVYIGPGVCIVEDVKIGNNVKIGAGTVVINDIPDGATSVGNPNRIILKRK